MKKRTIIILASAVVVVAAVAISISARSAKAEFSLETAKIGKGNISNTITATGTLEALKTVEVGTQVSGVIERIYVDFNSDVKKGQVIAEIDREPLLAQMIQSQANVDNAEAELQYQKSTFERNKALMEKNLIAQADYDLAQFNYKKSISNLSNAKSAHERNKINLSYATIYSPIDGIILDRAVDEGQTVAASFNTPTLFTIANDLTQMQVEANIDEADIGQVKKGQRVEFKVDAFPDMTFSGAVAEVRLQPVLTSNVVTYTVIINAPNPDKKLMPGLTANITVFVKEKNDILVVPGKALRFTPDRMVMWEYMESKIKSGAIPKPDGAGFPKPDFSEMKKKKGAGGFGGFGGGQLPPGGFGAFKGQGMNAEIGNTVWIKNGEMIRPAKIETGDNDGLNYEIISGLKEGDEIVTSLTKKTNKEVKKTATQSPFMPTPPGQRRR